MRDTLSLALQEQLLWKGPPQQTKNREVYTRADEQVYDRADEKVYERDL